MKKLILWLLLCHLVANSAELPQSVYDQLADPSVRVINMPAGTYTLKGAGVVNGVSALNLKRSNVTVNFTGCTLSVNPADGANSGFYPIQISSTPVTSPTYPPSPTGTGANARYISRLTGQISDTTMQLTMAAGEFVAVQSGETVLIWAGVTTSDPVEPGAFIPAVVACVNGESGLVTFTAPLGKNVINYGSLDGLRAATDDGLDWKVGAWGTYPSSANFSKGFGVDHGMERFVGGMVENITLKDLVMTFNPITSAPSMPNGMWDVSAIAVNNLTVENAQITNPHGTGLHLWRTFNATVNGFTILGTGSGKIFNVSTFEAVGFGVWGGDDLTFRNLSVQGTNMVVFGTEVGAEGISVDGLTYDSVFTSARTYTGSPTVLNFQGMRDTPTVKDASLRAVRTGGSDHIYFTYSPLILEGVTTFPGSSLTAPFDWGYQRTITLNGTVVIGGSTYGPRSSVTNQQTIVHGAGSRNIALPHIYTSLRFRILNVGDLRDVSDSFGNAYWASGGTSGWITVGANHWLQIPPGDAALAAYTNKALTFGLFNAGSLVDAVVELEYEYLPKN